jgi:DNA invertase Pin-like site-specific DNA recombinase
MPWRRSAYPPNASTSTTVSPAPIATVPGCAKRSPHAAPATTVVVTKLDRLARSLPDARDIVDDLTRRQVRLSLGGSVHDPTDPVSGGCCSTCWPWLPSSKPNLIRARTREGLQVAKAKGRLRGKQPKLTPRQEAHLVALHRTGEHTSAELFNVARSTVYRAIERDRAARPRSSTGSVALSDSK